MTKVHRFLIILIPIVLYGCSNPDSLKLSTKDIQEINQLSERWLKAYLQGDWEKVASFYTMDAVLMPPNGPEIIGRENIMNWFIENESGYRIQLENTDIDGRVDLAYVRGRYVLTIPVDSGKTIQDTGKYLDIRVKQDGKWFTSRDMFSSDLTR